MSPFEIGMLLCFGAAWPFSIRKSWRSRSTAGKSLVFLWIVLLGYLAGIVHKVAYHPDGVVFFYVANCLMVLADIVLYCRNRRGERLAS